MPTASASFSFVARETTEVDTYLHMEIDNVTVPGTGFSAYAGIAVSSGTVSVTANLDAQIIGVRTAFLVSSTPVTWTLHQEPTVGFTYPPYFDGSVELHDILGTGFSPFVVSPLPYSGPVLNDPITLAMSFKASIEQMVVTPPEYDDPAMVYGGRMGGATHISGLPTNRRLMPSVKLTLPTPAIISGKPMLPKYWAQLSSSVTLNQGPSHIHAIPKPNPVYNPGSHSYSTPPPDSGVGDLRWTVDDLPAPPSGGYYWLGSPSSFDGTSSIATAARQWSPSSATPGPSWHSVYPYKPSVWQHVHYGPYGEIHTETKGVRFNTQYIEHMWINMGTMTPPFTWIIVGIVMHFDTRKYVHSILDSGVNPASSVGNLGSGDLDVDRALSADPTSYRTAMRVGPTGMSVFTDHVQGPHTIYQPFNNTYKPKMFFMIDNGTHSVAGNFSTSGKHIAGGTLTSHSNQPLLVMGRKNGQLSKDSAAHFVAFEIRYWNNGLTRAQLDEQYDQLSSAWKFHEYT